MKKNSKIEPIISEKSTLLAASGWYSFRAPIGLNKKEAAGLIEDSFKVKVIRVNSLLKQGKKRRAAKGFGRTRPFKKILIKLKKGQKIGIFEVENPKA